MVQRIFDASPCIISFHHAYRGNHLSGVEDVTTVQVGSYSIDEWFHGEWWLVYLFEHVFH